MRRREAVYAERADAAACKLIECGRSHRAQADDGHIRTHGAHGAPETSNDVHAQ